MSNRNFTISPDARDDLLNIQDYIAENNIHAAETVIEAIFVAFSKLAQYPMMGHLRSDLTDRNIRFWSLYSYLIIYDAETSPISIVRVLSGYRDISAILQ